MAQVEPAPAAAEDSAEVEEVRAAAEAWEAPGAGLEVVVRSRANG